MFTYEGGLVIALLLWLYNAIMIIVSVNSQLERNLNRIGQRLSWLTLAPKPMDRDDEKQSAMAKVGKYLLIVGLGLPFVLLSWIYVGVALAGIAYRLIKDRGAPEAVRALRWRLRNAEMTFDQVVKESLKANGESPESFPEFREKIISELEERGLHRG